VTLRARSSPRIAALALAFVALAFPIGAWAASGMETGLATALATAAACSLDRERRAAVLAGLAASLRPELLPWVIVLIGLRRKPVAIAIAAAPFAICVLVRLASFGRAAPLAVTAKPSDLSHGAAYAGAAFVVTLLPVLALAPLAIRRAPRTTQAIALAFVAHVAAAIAVGGDWMPYARLFIPVVPSLAIVFADTVAIAHRASTAARAAIAAALGIYVAWKSAPAGRHVMRDRLALIEQAKPVLATSKIIAALDVGWVSAAAPSATIVDLAGLTDPTIAALPGGHTSKRVDAAMLVDRNVDTVLVYSQVRVVEGRLIESGLFVDRFDRLIDLPIGNARYAVYRPYPR
jgi:hypothetical protein